MSGESAGHIALVERLIAVIEERHGAQKNIVVFADHRRFALGQPPMIGGYKPDVLAHDLPATFRIIGEAKTLDLGDDRSLKQIEAFLDHLRLYPNAVFYLAVPWFLRGRANGLLSRIAKPEHNAVQIHVLSSVS